MRNSTTLGARLPLALLALLVGASTASAGSIHGKVALKGANGTDDAVVYVDTIPGKSFPPPTEHAVMDQKNLTFVPHVLPVLVGTTVDFKNSDNLAHNVFSLTPCTGGFNLGTWGQGKVKSHTFDKPCPAEILCIIHQEMDAWVVVVPTPYYAKTDADGTYTIPDVPDGSYTVKAWHQRVKGESQEVSVSGATEVDFHLGVDQTHGRRRR